MDAWWAFGWEWIPALQSLGSAWIEFMRVVSILGTEPFYMLVLPAVLWCYDVALGLRVGFILLGSAWLTAGLKWMIGLPRPYWVSPEVQALSAEASYGFPSGHAQTPLAVYGRIAAHVRRRWVTLATAVILLLIGISRLTLGVHFASNVLTGWLVGGLLLIAFLRWERPVAAWFSRRPLGTRLLVVVGITLVMIVVSWLQVTAALGRTLPQDWAANAIRAPNAEPFEPRDFREALDAAATLLGFGLGAVLLVEQGGFDARGGGSKRLGRFALGLVGVLALYFGLRAVFPGSETALGLGFRFVRYALVGFWVSYGAPWFFARAKLV
ncbi:MAG TPA: phosphatase PAP2 family protein [Anaerolineales bacterium]|nr:phosphatase PAP2 family protein [Anaerolineales bacterium]